MILLVFFIGKTIDLATFADSAQFSGAIYHDLENGLGHRSASDLNFDYAVGAWNTTAEEYVELDETYVWVKAAQEEYNQQMSRTGFTSEVAVSDCIEGTHFANAINSDEMSMQLHKCINPEQVELYGEMYSGDSRQVFVTVERCQNLTYESDEPQWQSW